MPLTRHVICSKEQKLSRQSEWWMLTCPLHWRYKWWRIHLLPSLADRSRWSSISINNKERHSNMGCCSYPRFIYSIQPSWNTKLTIHFMAYNHHHNWQYLVIGTWIVLEVQLGSWSTLQQIAARRKSLEGYVVYSWVGQWGLGDQWMGWAELRGVCKLQRAF